MAGYQSKLGNYLKIQTSRKRSRRRSFDDRRSIGGIKPIREVNIMNYDTGFEYAPYTIDEETPMGALS